MQKSTLAKEETFIAKSPTRLSSAFYCVLFPWLSSSTLQSRESGGQRQLQLLQGQRDAAASLRRPAAEPRFHWVGRLRLRTAAISCHHYRTSSWYDCQALFETTAFLHNKYALCDAAGAGYAEGVVELGILMCFTHRSTPDGLPCHSITVLCCWENAPLLPTVTVLWNRTT